MVANGHSEELRLEIERIATEALGPADSKEIARVLAGGKIRSEEQFYALRSRLDEIEGDPRATAEIDQLRAVLDSYENV
jgi:hypothetical protein